MDNDTDGECKRNAPSALSKHDANRDEVMFDGHAIVWPRIYSDDWCGEHQDFAKWQKNKKGNAPTPLEGRPFQSEGDPRTNGTTELRQEKLPLGGE